MITSSTDNNSIITNVSQAFCDLTGYTKDELLGKKHTILSHPDTKEDFYNQIQNTISSGKIWRGVIQNIKKDGSEYYVDATIKPDFDFYGNIIGYTALRYDISDKKKLELLSITDGLTKLYNRRHFDEVFKEYINLQNNSTQSLVFVIIDIDHFKKYNDIYGHQAGDETIKSVANIIDTNSKQNIENKAFRIGGEEFGLLLFVSNINEAKEILTNIKEKVEELKIEHSGNMASKFVTISTGAYIIEKNNIDIENIYINADKALYKVKNNGRNNIAFFNDVKD